MAQKALLPARAGNEATSVRLVWGRRYGMDYWIWTPVNFDPRNKMQASRLLEAVSEVSRDALTLTGVFVPGGDPGNHDPDVLLPFLGEIAERLRPAHPEAKVWLSMQRFSEGRAETVYRWLAGRRPEWFGGLVAGPSSPPVAETRRRMPAGMQLRLYPDVSHNKLSQFEVPEWDQAYALVLGREAINPRPTEYAALHRRIAPATGAGRCACCGPTMMPTSDDGS